MRELGRASKAAVDLIKHLPRRFQNRVNHRRGYFFAARKRFRPRDRALDHLRLLQHLAVFFAIGLSNRNEHALKAGPPVTIRRGEVRAPIKRFAVGSEKRRQRPPALSRQRGHRHLIAAVNIGTLVPIHLYRDVMLVDDRRHVGIVIRLTIHHMTPVTPHRADIQKHRLIRRTSRRKSFLTKFVPLNGLMHRRTQIGRRGAGEGVWGRRGH